jgi:Zn-dependent peptidase ImmA (M78 family)
MVRKKITEKRTPFNLPIPGWNERRMTSEDFMQVCAREGITATRLRFTSHVRGSFYRQNGRPFIVTDSRLRGLERIRVEFHELGHYFLHSAGFERLKRMPGDPRTPETDWAEVEAHLVSMVALAPGFDIPEFLQFISVAEGRLSRRKGRR